MTMRRTIIYAGITLAGVLSLVFASNPVAFSQSVAFTQPTLAPTATPGDALPEQVMPSVPHLPIGTAVEAVAAAAAYASQQSEWKEPWSVETLTTDPGRIQVKEFASRSEESADARREETYSADVEADAGGIWRVTVRGAVQMAMLGTGVDPNARYDGATYVFSKRTGNLLALISGLPLK